MIQTGTLEMLDVGKIELDRANPRICRLLEMYPNPSADHIFLALGAHMEDDHGPSATFEKLKASILRNGGIIQPVLVNKHGGQYTCIEGNTRLALYQHFLKTKVKGSWQLIPALVYVDMEERQKDAIRLQLHLVGTRAWDAYSKARYLHQLRMQDLLPFDQIVEFSGGRRKEVLESINAFEAMEEYYRPIAGEGGFDQKKFSGFVELQKPGIKEALSLAGFTEADFAQWIHAGTIAPLMNVRMLPNILRSPRAKEVFLKAGSKRAIETLDRPSLDETLTKAPVAQLARALSFAIFQMKFPDADAIRKDPASEVSLALRDAATALEQLLSDGSED